VPWLRVQIRLDDDDNVQRWCELFVQQLGLVDAGLGGILNGRGFERLLRNAAVIQLTAKRAMWAIRGMRTKRAKFQIAPSTPLRETEGAGDLPSWAVAMIEA